MGGLAKRSFLLLKPILAQEADMQALCHEVRKFISACEDIQSLLAQGRSLTSDEKGVIEQSAMELLSNVKLDLEAPHRMQNGYPI